MSVPSNSTTTARPASPLLIGIVVVGLILFIAWRAWSAFSGPQAGRLPPAPTKDTAFLQQKAQECQGDFSKLSPQDQNQVQKISQGFGAAAMASTYRKMSRKSP